MYSQTGTKLAIAGIVAVFLSHYVGASVEADFITKVINDILSIGGDIVTIYGIIHQAFAHKKLAVTTGTFPVKPV